MQHLESTRKARIMFAARLLFDPLKKQLVRMDEEQPLNESIYPYTNLRSGVGVPSGPGQESSIAVV